MSGDNGKFVNTQLSSEQIDDFERVKAFYGINTNSDVVRFLIRQEARRLDAPRAAVVATEAQAEPQPVAQPA